MPRLAHVVPCILESRNELTEKLFVSTYRKAFDVLEYKRACVKLRDDAHKLQHEAIAWVFQSPVPNQRKSLARRPAEHAIYRASGNPARLPDVLRAQPDDRAGNYGTAREVEFMGGAMNGVDLNGGDHVEAGLLEA
jgi:hypothetical protein